jgi:type VI secretion system FHA domain protein
MPVKLLVKSYRQQPPENPLWCLIDSSGTLGRGPDNDLVLTDPGKYISRAHSRVERREGGYYLIDIGSNPSVVNERLLGNGRETALQEGDQLVIGDYCIDVSMLEAVAVVADQTGVGHTQTLAVFMPPPVVTAVPLPLLEDTPPSRSEPGFSRPEVQTDALAAASILHGESVFDPAPEVADPLGLNLFTDGAARSHKPVYDGADIAPLLPAFRGTESDHVAPQLQALPVTASHVASGPGASLIPMGYDALADLMGPVVPPDAVPAQSEAVERPAPTVEQTSPAHLMQPLQPDPPQPVRAETVEVDDAQHARSDATVFRALLEGLGLPDLRTSRSPAVLARLVGEMLSEATDGTMAVLMARALTKRESHIDMTMIGARSNNPLKFFPDAASALSQMLSTDAPAYLPGVQALTAAFDDLKAHELAVIAGMREALSEVAQRISPARIEERMPGRPFDGLLPSARKARLWERFNELYGELVRDGEEDLHLMFGDTFSQAYQQQVARLRATP